MNPSMLSHAHYAFTQTHCWLPYIRYSIFPRSCNTVPTSVARMCVCNSACELCTPAEKLKVVVYYFLPSWFELPIAVTRAMRAAFVPLKITLHMHTVCWWWLIVARSWKTAVIWRIKLSTNINSLIIYYHNTWTRRWAPNPKHKSCSFCPCKITGLVLLLLAGTNFSDDIIIAKKIVHAIF